MPVLEQYANWLKNIVLHWDWGYSKTYQPNVAASVIIVSRIGYSIRLNIISVIFSVPIGILLGIWAALKKNTMTDHTISTMVMVFISIPSFVLISFVLRIFCYSLDWLPSTWPPDTAPLAARVRGYIIPVFCLSFGSICGYCRFTRAELCEVMESDYLLLARTKGLTRRQAIVRHAGSATSGSRHNAFKVRLAARNSVWLVKKNMPPAQIVFNLPYLAAGCAVKWGYFLRKGLGKEYAEGILEGLGGAAAMEGAKAVQAGTDLRAQLWLWRGVFVQIFEFLSR